MSSPSAKKGLRELRCFGALGGKAMRMMNFPQLSYRIKKSHFERDIEMFFLRFQVG